MGAIMRAILTRLTIIAANRGPRLLLARPVSDMTYRRDENSTPRPFQRRADAPHPSSCRSVRRARAGADHPRPGGPGPGPAGRPGDPGSDRLEPAPHRAGLRCL